MLSKAGGRLVRHAADVGTGRSVASCDCPIGDWTYQTAGRIGRLGPLTRGMRPLMARYGMRRATGDMSQAPTAGYRTAIFRYFATMRLRDGTALPRAQPFLVPPAVRLCGCLVERRFWVFAPISCPMSARMGGRMKMPRRPYVRRNMRTEEVLEFRSVPVNGVSMYLPVAVTRDPSTRVGPAYQQSPAKPRGRMAISPCAKKVIPDAPTIACATRAGSSQTSAGYS